MSFKKNQRSYNKNILKMGKEATQYMKNALNLYNQYTVDYQGRQNFWLNRLNDRQLNLLSDKYLKQNADMLRGQSAFGSNSSLAQQQQETAYSQNNYLADVANKNVQLANQIQNSELSALASGSKIYENPVIMGRNAAQNEDAYNWSWLNSIGKGMQTVGQAGMASGNPYAMAIGAAVNQTGGTISAMTSQETDPWAGMNTQTVANTQTFKQALKDIQAKKEAESVASPNTLSTFSGTSGSSLGGINKGLNTNIQMPKFGGFGK